MPDLRAIAKDTLDILERGYYINHNNDRQEITTLLQPAVEGTVLYTPQVLDELLQCSNIRMES